MSEMVKDRICSDITIIKLFVFILIIGLQDYTYSSTEGVERYTQQCKTFLNQNSGEFKDESFEQLLGYIGNATICKKEKVYKNLTEGEKNRLNEINLNIDQIKVGDIHFLNWVQIGITRAKNHIFKVIKNCYILIHSGNLI